MEKSKNFRIDALLAEAPPRPVPSGSPQGLSPGSSAGSPGSCARTETPSPRAPHGAAPLPAPGFIPKPGLLHLPPPGLSALPAMYPPPLYSLGAHPAFPYPGFAHLPQPGPEHLKAAAVAGSFPLEHWIRAGMMLPRLSDFHGEARRPVTSLEGANSRGLFPGDAGSPRERTPLSCVGSGPPCSHSPRGRGWTQAEPVAEQRRDPGARWAAGGAGKSPACNPQRGARPSPLSPASPGARDKPGRDSSVV
uniref:Uncharacterized protein n=1 Tax=Chelydra serpentina TaxID=8475 RepID=A0A8C3SFH4_CHESE